MIDPLKHQEGGAHYTSMKIQPIEYIMANNIPFVEGCIIKYVSRWRNKGGVEDLKKARHFLDILIGTIKEVDKEIPILRVTDPFPMDGSVFRVRDCDGLKTLQWNESLQKYVGVM